ncbi:MAG: peptidylprolyl isomerase [Proteobacteria bacterium]|nr:peptidylprolyl isomerase [Pseudomonadota bacterium]
MLNTFLKFNKLFLLTFLLLNTSIAKGAGSAVQNQKPKSGDTIAVINTNQGTMKAIIFTSLVPKSAANFIELAKQGKYANVPFHRVIKDFMIQGGDFTNKNGTGGHSAEGPGKTISDEYHSDLSHIRGAVSWAKTSAPHSIGSQFYIVHPEKGAHFLDHPKNGGPAEGYSVFGQVYEGLDVIDKIADAATDASDKPLTPMTIESITIEQVK